MDSRGTKSSRTRRRRAPATGTAAAIASVWRPPAVTNSQLQTVPGSGGAGNSTRCGTLGLFELALEVEKARPRRPKDGRPKERRSPAAVRTSEWDPPHATCAEDSKDSESNSGIRTEGLFEGIYSNGWITRT